MLLSASTMIIDARLVMRRSHLSIELENRKYINRCHADLHSPVRNEISSLTLLLQVSPGGGAADVWRCSSGAWRADAAGAHGRINRRSSSSGERHTVSSHHCWRLRGRRARGVRRHYQAGRSREVSSPLRKSREGHPS